jgi:hypothetical protein
MIIFKMEWQAPSYDPEQSKLVAARHQEGVKLRIWEMVIMLDHPDSKDWYVADTRQVLSDRITVKGYTTAEILLVGYPQASKRPRAEALTGVPFLRTWCKDKKGKERLLWKWRLPIGEVNQILLVRNVYLGKDGCLCKTSRNLAAGLKFPHHAGTGGYEDFIAN